MNKLEELESFVAVGKTAHRGLQRIAGRSDTLALPTVIDEQHLAGFFGRPNRFLPVGGEGDSLTPFSFFRPGESRRHEQQAGQDQDSLHPSPSFRGHSNLLFE